MDQNFSLMAQSRANYYTAGSPVQFVRVELLKGDATGEVAVCLSFKNIGTTLLTGMVIHFKCKDAAGQVLCEDDFYYENLQAKPGDLFGTDDAVFVSDTPVSSVEIEQDRAFLNGKGIDLRGCKRVKLDTPRALPASIAKALQIRTGNASLCCVPQDIENGWFCACGAFHPNEEAATVCSECGGDRAFVKAALTSVLEEARQAAVKQEQELNPQPKPPVDVAAATAAAARAAIAENEPATAQFAPVAEPDEVEDDEEETDVNMKRFNPFVPKKKLFEDDVDDEEEISESTRMFDTDETASYDTVHEDAFAAKSRGRYADDEEETEDDRLAENIIHWAPPITAIICALIVALTLIYYFVIA